MLIIRDVNIAHIRLVVMGPDETPVRVPKALKHFSL